MINIRVEKIGESPLTWLVRGGHISTPLGHVIPYFRKKQYVFSAFNKSLLTSNQLRDLADFVDKMTESYYNNEVE